MIETRNKQASLNGGSRQGNSDIWKILLVDDDEDEYVLIKELLSENHRQRFNLQWCQSYQQALQTIFSETYDVILVDYSLGISNGVNLIHEVTARGCQTPLILVTGNGSYEIDLKGMQAGAVDFLNKGDLTGVVLERSIRYAIKQKKTEQALAEANAALRQSRQDLVEILESISDGFFALDHDWRFIYINRRAANNGGKEPEALIGQIIWDVFPNLVNTPLWMHYHDVMERREPAHFELDGSAPEKDYAVSVYPTARGISVYWLDISSQKRAERALAASLARLTRLIDISSEVLKPKSVNELLQTIVDAACELTGARVGTCGHGYIEGKFRIGVTSRAKDFLPCPSGERFTGERGGVYKLLLDSVFSLRLTKDALYKHPAWKGVPEGHAPLNGLLGARMVNALGLPNGLIMVSDKVEGEFTEEDEALLVQLAAMASLSLQHIEARQEAEQAAERAQRNADQASQTAHEIENERARLEVLLQQMPAGVLIAEAPSGKIILGNQQITEIWGEDFVLPQRLDEYQAFDCIHQDGRQYRAQEWPLARSILYGETVAGEEILFRKCDGKVGTMLVNSVPITSHDGMITAGVAVLLDITEQRRLEARHVEYTAQMEVQRRLLEHREMERLQIARDLHDGPVQELISLMFAVQTAITLTQEPPVVDVLKEVRQSAQHLVEDLRNFFKQLRPPTLIKFGLEKAIRAHAEDFSTKAGVIDLHLNLMQDREILPSGIRLALYRIYQESFNNIARHAKAKTMEVQFFQENDRIVLEIHDDGAGFAMPNDWVELARQGHLGLVGMKERAEAVGGTLTVSSVPGVGTRVRVEVPWTDPE